MVLVVVEMVVCGGVRVSDERVMVLVGDECYMLTS